ncbi:hypothetical protein EX30DRAFT_344730 [Ascodesmis nigricans]|uniref:Uncharacterized protein n=1 Tax=Ascodesmis nigricans TaxID=341454 RepID=A0A4S2MIV6_9PEZI|nr:hypothetical protein EX30DRAFT_344730 [Ascodesmis nigricans]
MTTALTSSLATPFCSTLAAILTSIRHAHHFPNPSLLLFHSVTHHCRHSLPPPLPLPPKTQLLRVSKPYSW